MTDSLITDPYAYAAVLYRQAGWIAPLPVVGKDINLPREYTGYEGIDPDDAKIAEWIDTRGGDNVCLRLPDDVIGIDVDAYDGRRGAETIHWMAEQVGCELPPTWKVTSRDDGESGIYLFRVPRGIRWRSALGRGSNVEIIRRAHRYAVSWPSIHPDTQRRYHWYRPDGTISLDEVPDIQSLSALQDAWVDALSKGTLTVGSESDSTRGTGDHSNEDLDSIDVDGQPVDVTELLRSGIPIGEQNEVLYRYLCSMRARGFKREEMMYLAGHVIGISPTGDVNDPWTQENVIEIVDRVRREYRPGASPTALTPELQNFVERLRRGDVEDQEAPPREEFATDLGNTLRFARIHRDRVRYAADENQWYVWDGTRWAPDRLNQVYDLTLAVIDDIRLAALTIDDADERGRWGRWAHDSESLSRRRAIIEGAKSNPDLVVTADQFDTNPWIMACRNGTVDLRTGQLRPADPVDLCTRQANVSFDPAADCPRWNDHIRFITCGSPDLATYLMVQAGYSLTGLTTERSFYFLEGKGLNGKNVFIEPILHVMGTYAATASTSLLTGGDEQHPTILADLRGKRFVFIDEVRQGKRLNVERIKALTGSKRIKARQMREDFFEFDAQFKLWLAGNGQPTVKDPSDGAWDRMKRVPFTARVAEEDLIRDLGQTLFDDEAAGIFNWLLKGVVYWAQLYERGQTHPVPAQVLAAVKEHRHDEDDVQQFLDLNPLVKADSPLVYLQANDVYARYRDWALLTQGIKPADVPKANDFGKRLREKYELGERKTKRIDGKMCVIYAGWRWDEVAEDDLDNA